MKQRNNEIQQLRIMQPGANFSSLFLGKIYMIYIYNDSAEKRDKEPASQLPRELLCPFVPLVKY